MAYKCTYCGQTGHTGLNCSSRPQPGQIWKMDKHKFNVKIEVLSYKTQKRGTGTMKYFDGKCIESDHPLYTVGDTYGFIPTQFIQMWMHYEEAPDTQPQKSSVLGAQCVKCKNDYPYAEVVGDFTCWSCENGY